MELWARFWVLVTRLLHFTTLSSFDGDESQSRMGVATPTQHLEPFFVPPALTAETDAGPVFRPPGHRQDNGDGSSFHCNYTAMTGWTNCSTPDRSCWLVNKATGQRFDINTDYENEYPTGVTREYWLDVTKSDVLGDQSDGYTFTGATLFNGTYPGPWIQACWGDTVVVHVRNTNPDRGTSVHWHGIRQLRTMHMDGVVGITQCPIAPGSSFTYQWKVMQYGSAWYHSHYSEQYADGAVGPITLHGPSSGQFDEAADIPLLMTDWRHGSAFDPDTDSDSGKDIVSILLNGTGDVTQFWDQKNTTDIPTPYTLVFDEKKAGSRPRRYLLRLINTSIGTTFVFSIDNHLLTIVSADFVPIYPYVNTSVLIGIGQRYNVIVEADPRANGDTQPPDDKNFWIRTWVATNCGPTSVYGGGDHYEKTGILRYSSSSTAKPQSSAWKDVGKKCSDETYTSLRPVLPWIVGDPINNMSTNTGLQHMAVVLHSEELPGFPKASFAFRNVSGGALAFTPLQVNFSDPVFLQLDGVPSGGRWEIYPEGRDGKEDWVWLAITVDNDDISHDTNAHPIHLHGHDFAILQQAEKTPFTKANIRINRYNPPRRDVVLMPENGFVIIAFKADNPGSWLLHCHIAVHASQGLALQIMERQADAADIWPKGDSAIEEAATLCSSWDDWVKASNTATPLPDDSGI